MDEGLQKKYMEFQVIEQQIKQITKQVQELDNKMLELEYLKKSLDELSGVKKDTEILAPISPGIFIKAKLATSDELLVNVGGNAVVGKDIKGTKDLLDFQITEIENLRTQLITEMSNLSENSQVIEQELVKLTEAKDV